MPQYKLHLGAGTILYACLQLVLYRYTGSTQPLSWYVATLLSCLFGSLFPDIDTKSKVQKISYTILLLLLLVLLIFRKTVEATCIAIFSMLPLTVHHRGLFHRYLFLTLLTIAALGAASFAYPGKFVFMAWNIGFFALGAFSHVVLDRTWGESY